MKTGILLITLALLTVKVCMAQTNYAAAIADNSGTFISNYHYNQQITYFNVLPGVNEVFTDVLGWQDGAGGTETDFSYDDWETYSPHRDAVVWPTNSWPMDLPAGTNTVTDYTNSPYTNAAATVTLQGEHSIFSEAIPSNATKRRAADTEMKLATGGPPGSTQMNLWCISAWVWNTDTGEMVPYDQISIGSYGKPNPDGNLWVMLPDNDPTIVTLKTPSPKTTFQVRGTKYPTAIMVNGVTLDPTKVVPGADFCVGQALYFEAVGIPSQHINDDWAIWSLPGTYVNEQPDQKCLAFYDKKDALLTRHYSTDGTTSTTSWYVRGDKITVSVEIHYDDYYDRFSGGIQFTQKLTGQFNVFRPTVIAKNPYPDGLPTVQFSGNGNFLFLGDLNRHNDMSFQHQINSSVFSGDAGYIQLVGFSGNDFNDQDQTSFSLQGAFTPINLTPSDNLDTLPGGVFPRGTTNIPAFDANNPNNGWTQPFYDAPHIYLADSAYTTTMHLHFHTYLMFMPKASGPIQSIFVPLEQINWFVKASGQRVKQLGSDHESYITDDSDCSIFPHWYGEADLNANQPPDE